MSHHWTDSAMISSAFPKRERSLLALFSPFAHVFTCLFHVRFARSFHKSLLDPARQHCLYKGTSKSSWNMDLKRVHLGAENLILI